MTLDELKSAVSTNYTSFVETYGAAVVAMTSAEALSFVNLLAQGNEADAYALVVGKMSDAEALAEAKKITAAWNTANTANATSIALQKKAVTALLGGILTIVLAAVGL